MIADGTAPQTTPAPSSSEITLGVTLRRLRRARGLTMRDMIGPLHLAAHSSIVDYETGRRIPAPDILAAYEQYFALAPGSLLKLRARELGARADRESAALRLVAARLRVPRALPAAAAHFIGRTEHLETLSRLVASDVDRSAPIVLSAIDGMAGVGKTALAVHFAHRCAERFPDGQLYVNLRGFDPTARPMTTTEAICGFLDSLAVPSAHIPPTPEAQTALYRSLLADKRMLVLLDNARDAEQARALLPGSSTCLVLVTSRNKLTGLAVGEGAHLIDLDLLSRDEARQLLIRRLGPDRIGREHQETDELIETCGGLPLALNIIAALAAQRPGEKLRTLLDDLREARSRLDALGTSDPATDLRSVFSCSYQRLSDAAAGMFRLIGAHPSPDISVQAAAAIAGTNEPTAHALLRQLAEDNLVTQHTPGRFTAHDLLRAFAAEQALSHESSGEGDSLAHRALEYYLHTAYAAARQIAPTRGLAALDARAPYPAARSFADQHSAHAWLREEAATLALAVEFAHTNRYDAHAWQIAWAAADHLDRDGQWARWRRMQQVALASARRCHDQTAEGLSLRLLACAETQLRAYPEAQEHLEQALSLYEEHGDVHGAAPTHLELARVHGRQYRYDRALAHALSACAIHEATGEISGQAVTLSVASRYHILTGDHAAAAACAEKALDLHREINHPASRGDAWCNLALALKNLGQVERAVEAYGHALDLYREVGDRYDEACALDELGDAQRESDHTAAHDAWRQAAAILEALEHPRAAEIHAKLKDMEPLYRPA